MPQLHNHSRPFSLEHITAALSRLLSPGPVLVWALVSYRKLHNQLGRRPSFAELRSHSPWLARIALFVILKTANAAASRLIANNGWQRDRPKWNEEIVLVTGGVGGIGAETVSMLLSNFPGVKVVVFDMAEPKTRARTLDVRYYKVNITNPDEIKSAADDIRQHWGPPTMLVNNAGIMRSKSLLALTAKEFSGTYAVNTTGAFNILKEFLPAMVAKDHGHVVTIASTAAFVTAPGTSDYSASKAGVMALHECVTAELKGRLKAPKIRTTMICPVKVDTPLGSIVKDLKDKFVTPTQQPWQIAERIVLALDSGLSGGTVFAPSYLWAFLPLLRVLPTWYLAYMHKSSGLDEFSTEQSRGLGVKGGYKILGEDE